MEVEIPIAPPPRTITRQQWTLIGLILAITAGSILYRVLEKVEMGHTAAIFLGIPSILAIILTLTPRAGSATGGILKGMTLFLLILAPILGEGFICILIASPLFYAVGALVGVLVDHSRKKQRRALSSLLVLLVPLSLEGVIPALTFDRTQIVEVTRVVGAPAAAVELSLAQAPDLANAQLPRYAPSSFPHPISASGSGLGVGDVRTVTFSAAEDKPAGDLVMRVAAASPGMVRFEAVSDQSKLGQWMRWQSSEVTWRAVDPTHTEVTWRIQFQRQLDPAWYFTPLERLAAHEAAGYLIQANATPAGK